MLRLFGAVHTLVAALEPPLGVPIHNTNTNGSSSQTNLAIFMVLFMLCAIEVVFIKIVTSVQDEMVPNGQSRHLHNHRRHRHHHHHHPHHHHHHHHHHEHQQYYSSSSDFMLDDDANNNNQAYYTSPTYRSRSRSSSVVI